MVYYDRYDIVFQEIPNEISLAFTIKGCKNNCKGCHSPHLRENGGNELTEKLLLDLILNKYNKQITNVLFLGEGSDKEGLLELMKIASAFSKVSIYSGSDVIEPDYLLWVDYYKVGSYKEELGGLDCNSTNQKLLKINVEDITDKLRE